MASQALQPFRPFHDFPHRSRFFDMEPFPSAFNAPTLFHDAPKFFQEHVREMERYFQRLQDELNQEFGKAFLPALTLSPSDGFRLEPEIVSEGDGTKYRLSIRVGDTFTPDDVKVSLKDNIMKIEAKKEKNDEGNNFRSRVSQEIRREFTLPPNVDLKEVKSVLTPDGVLKIEAPAVPQQKLAALPAPRRYGDLTIPIRHE